MSRNFKKEYRMAACTQPPWSIYIEPTQRPEILRQIRQECIDMYGYSLDECPNRLICFKKGCIGRPIPYKSKTAEPYIKNLEKTGLIKNNKLFVIQKCDKCKIKDSCVSICNQILDYIERDKVLEPLLYYKDEMENFNVEAQVIESFNIVVDKNDIPWDILSKRRKDIVKEYLYKGRDFRYVSEKLNINNQAFAKYEFYAALTKLSEYARMRLFLKNNSNLLTERQKLILNLVYINNMTQVEAGKFLKISKQSIQQTIARVIKKHNIKITKFVRKNKTQPIYNVMEIFK